MREEKKTYRQIDKNKYKRQKLEIKMESQKDIEQEKRGRETWMNNETQGK